MIGYSPQVANYLCKPTTFYQINQNKITTPTKAIKQPTWKADQSLAIATDLVTKFDIISLSDDFYQYNEGIWEPLKLRKKVESIIHTAYATRGIGYPTMWQISDTIGVVWIVTYNIYGPQIDTMSSKLKRAWEIPLRSWLYDIATNTVREYERKDLMFASLPFDLILDEEERTNYIRANIWTFKSFITSVFKDEQHTKVDWSQTEEWQTELANTIMFIQEWLWYSFLWFNPLEKTLIMYWEWRNWKWTLNETWKTILWKDNYCTLSAEEINDPRYLWRTKNKLVNFSDDMNTNVQLDTWVIKWAASNEEVSSDRKFRDQDQFYFTCKLIMACNKMPYLRNPWTAVKERFQIMTFKNEFTEDKANLKINLKEDLEKDAEAVFNWAVDWLIRIYKNKKFTVPKSIKEDVQSYMDEFDIVGLWFKEDEDIHIGPDNKIKPNDLYKHFNLFAASSWKQVLSKPNFYKKIEKMGYEKKLHNWYAYFHWLRYWQTENERVAEWRANK